MTPSPHLADTAEGVRAAQLLEANEQLVLAWVRAQSEADTAAGVLDAASRSDEFDALTGLPNRVLLNDRLAQAIARARRHDACLALMFLDLDRFKRINDTLGHAVGDEVLKQAAHCLASSVRDADTVSRHGGDEFLILLNEISQPTDAAHIAEKLLVALALPRQICGHRMSLMASIGISVYPHDGEDIATLTNRADAAMYRVKRRGQGGFVFHGSPMSEAPTPGTEVPDPPDRHDHLQEANQQLILAALSAQELQAAAERSQQRQAESLAVVAHELRNPLAPIRTAAALMARVGATELPRIRAIIERQVAHLSRLVDDLLDVSRATTGKLRLVRHAVDLGGLVDGAADACRPAMQGRHQQLHVHMPECEITLDGDAVRLTQVLSNLLDNASKYSPQGAAIDLSVAVDEVGDAVVITVADVGIGITAETLPNVFEPFVQDEHAVGFNGAGLGIGLTVVRELVAAHGGSVGASSAGPGHGSRFVVRLPRASRRGSGHP